MKLTDEEKEELENPVNWDLVAIWTGLIGGFGLLALGVIATYCT